MGGGDSSMAAPFQVCNATLSLSDSGCVQESETRTGLIGNKGFVFYFRFFLGGVAYSLNAPDSTLRDHLLWGLGDYMGIGYRTWVSNMQVKHPDHCTISLWLQFVL